MILPDEHISTILDRANAQPGYQLFIDLENCEVSDDHGLHVPFVIHEDSSTHDFRRHTLMNGLDSIGLTLKHENKIDQYEKNN